MRRARTLYLSIAVVVCGGKGGVVPKVVTVADGRRRGPIRRFVPGIEIGHK